MTITKNKHAQVSSVERGAAQQPCPPLATPPPSFQWWHQKEWNKSKFQLTFMYKVLVCVVTNCCCGSAKRCDCVGAHGRPCFISLVTAFPTSILSARIQFTFTATNSENVVYCWSVRRVSRHLRATSIARRLSAAGARVFFGVACNGRIDYRFTLNIRHAKCLRNIRPAC